MKTSTRNIVIALSLFAGFAIYYHAYEPADRSLVPSHRARESPAVYVPPEPKFDEEEWRKRQEFNQLLTEIYGPEMREVLENARKQGAVFFPPGEANSRERARLESKTDPARPVESLEKRK